MKTIEAIVSTEQGKHRDVLKRVAESLQGIPSGFEIAVSRAMNRAVLAGRTVGIATIREEYALKASTVRQHFVIEKAHRNSTEATIAVRGSMLPLSQFETRPRSDTTGAKRKPVRVVVSKKRGVQTLKDSFIYKGRILKRLGKSSTPVKSAYGPAIPLLASNSAIQENIMNTMDKVFVERLDHEVLYLLANSKGKK